MGGWRTKLVFLLIVYFAGFATAIYCLAPAGENRSLQRGIENNRRFASFSSEQFADSFNSGMHKCIDFGKSAAVRMGGLLKDKVAEMVSEPEQQS